jgi:hypothetical protein
VHIFFHSCDNMNLITVPPSAWSPYSIRNSRACLFLSRSLLLSHDLILGYVAGPGYAPRLWSAPSLHMTYQLSLYAKPLQKHSIKAFPASDYGTTFPLTISSPLPLQENFSRLACTCTATYTVKPDGPRSTIRSRSHSLLDPFVFLLICS